MKRQQMVVFSRAAEVDHPWAAMRNVQVPDVGEELFGESQVRHVECHTAQTGNQGGGMRHALSFLRF